MFNLIKYKMKSEYKRVPAFCTHDLFQAFLFCNCNCIIIYTELHQETAFVLLGMYFVDSFPTKCFAMTLSVRF